jgi:hypothetical protein
MGMVGALALCGFPVTLMAAKKPKPVKIAGIVTEIEPTRVSVRSGDGAEVSVITREDFGEKVAIGSKVTVYYSGKDGTKVLDWLEYPLENCFRSPQEILGQVKRIIVLPSSEVLGAEGLFDGVANFLESKVGWYVAPRVLAEELRDRAQKSPSTLEAIDPSTGEFDLARYTGAQLELVRKVASETRVDAVLEARVEQVRAYFHSNVATWDGAQQPVAGRLSRTLAMVAAVPAQGQVPAATLALKLRDAQGTLLWSNRRGFAVLALQVGVGSKFRDRPIPEALQDTASVEQWFTTVFGSFLPAPGSNTAGSAP